MASQPFPLEEFLMVKELSKLNASLKPTMRSCFSIVGGSIKTFDIPNNVCCFTLFCSKDLSSCDRFTKILWGGWGYHIYVLLHPLSSTFIDFPPLLSTFIHFHPLSSSWGWGYNIYALLHPLSFTFLLFRLLSSTFIIFHPLSSTFILFHLLEAVAITSTSFSRSQYDKESAEGSIWVNRNHIDKSRYLPPYPQKLGLSHLYYCLYYFCLLFSDYLIFIQFKI